MKKNGIETLADAARRLGVGVDTLKSIMSSRGKQRFADETLKSVLEKIGYKERP